MLASPLIVAATLLSGVAPSEPAPRPYEGSNLAPVPARYAFVPVGFDDNDEAQVVIDGYLPSGCYRLTGPDVVVDRAMKTIKIRPLARYFDIPCVEALIPYQLEVNLGVLPEGRYVLSLNHNGYRRNPNPTPSLPGPDLLHQTFEITHAKQTTPDDELYAPVDSVRVSSSSGDRNLRATIEGRLTSTCMKWKELRIQDHGPTINLIPVIEMASPPPEGCQNVEIFYQKEIPLPPTLTPGRHLLHVRSLNGRALNALFYAHPWVF